MEDTNAIENIYRIRKRIFGNSILTNIMNEINIISGSAINGWKEITGKLYPLRTCALPNNKDITIEKNAVAGVGTPEKFFNKYPFLEKRTKRIKPNVNIKTDDTVTNKLYKGPN